MTKRRTTIRNFCFSSQQPKLYPREGVDRTIFLWLGLSAGQGSRLPNVSPETVARRLPIRFAAGDSLHAPPKRGLHAGIRLAPLRYGVGTTAVT